MFSNSLIKKIFKNAGAIRIGKDAISKFKKILEKYSLVTAKKSVKNAKYSGRKSVKAEDVEEAIKL